MIGGTEGKTILAINNKKKPLDDVRVRRAIAYAIDRKAIIDGAQNGYGAPIGSHLTPNDPGYVDLTGEYPHDPAKAKALAEGGGRHDAAPALADPAAARPTRAKAARSSRPNWRKSASRRRSKTSNGRNGCPASTPTRISI